MKNILGFILYLANTTSIFYSKKENFYPVKKRLLERYGKHIAIDYQHIKEYCWTCNGTGMVFENNICHHCYGTGIYKEFISILRVYKLGKYTFHVPIKMVRNYDPDFNQLLKNKTISGYITHDNRGKLIKREAALLLLLFCDLKRFKNEIGKIGHMQLGFYPLVFFEYFLFRIRHFNVKNKFNKLINFTIGRKRINIVFDDDFLPF
jgi:ribosomal protein S17E